MPAYRVFSSTRRIRPGVIITEIVRKSSTNISISKIFIIYFSILSWYFSSPIFMVRKRNVSQKRKLERKAYRRRNTRLSVSALSDNASETFYDKEVSCDLINSARNIRDLMEMMVSMSKIRRLELEHKRKAYLCKNKYRKKHIGNKPIKRIADRRRWFRKKYQLKAAFQSEHSFRVLVFKSEKCHRNHEY